MVTAWSATTRMALVNVLAPGNNEAAGALHLVELLQLKGCVVTADALHCHRGMAKAIVERGGDYVLAVKNNQPGLLRDAKAAISAAERKKAKQATTREPVTAAGNPNRDRGAGQGYGRRARLSGSQGRREDHQQTWTRQNRRALLPSDPYYTPAELLRVVREHWGIENVLHWTLDVVLDEDQTRSRKDHAPPTSPFCADLPQYRSRSSRYKDLVARQTQTRAGTKFCDS